MPNMLLVLDASVILKWFLEEEYSDVALKIRENFYREICRIIEPDFLLYEFVNVLRYNPVYTEEDVIKAVNSLIETDIDIVLPTVELLETAINIAKRYDVTVYDAIYIALAKLISRTYITADKKLYEKVKELKFVKFISEF
jgi:predicted nucleic acid-binding protein